MSLASLFRRNARRDAAFVLYGALVEQARQPAFFAELGVPDTLDGRFELIALHAFLVLNRLKTEPAAGRELGQELFDVMFMDMDRALREMGVGDLSVGRRVREMAEAFYGRIGAYEAGLATADGALGEALGRNLYGTVAPPPAAPMLAHLADYVRAGVAALAEQEGAALGRGELRFPPPPAAGDAP